MYTQTTQNILPKSHWDPRIKQFQELVIGDCYRANGHIHEASFLANGLIQEAWGLAQHYWAAKPGPGLIPLDVFMALPHAQQMLDCKLAIIEHEGFADILEYKIWAALEAKSKGLGAAKTKYGLTIFTSKRTKNEEFVYVKGCVDQMLWFTLNAITGKIGGILSAEARRKKYGTAQPGRNSGVNCVGIAISPEGVPKGSRRTLVGSPNSLYKNSNVRDSSYINIPPFLSSSSDPSSSLNLKTLNTHTHTTQSDVERETLDDAPRIFEGSVCGGKDLISNRKKEITSVQRFENYWLQNSPPIDIPSGESLWGMISQGVKNKWLEVYPLEFLEATTNKAYLHYSVLNEHKRPRNMGDWIEKLSSWFANRIEQYRRQSPHKKTPDERAKEIAELEALRIVPRTVN